MKTLPNGFEILTRILDRWSLATEKERFNARIGSTLEELKEFYDEILPFIDKVGDYLSGIPASMPLTAAEQNLYNLAASYLEVSRCFEAWSAVDVRCDFFDPEKIEMLHDIS